MKPSERILEHAERAARKRWADIDWERMPSNIRETCTLEAIVRYLDEEWEARQPVKCEFVYAEDPK